MKEQKKNNYIEFLTMFCLIGLGITLAITYALILITSYLKNDISHATDLIIMILFIVSFLFGCALIYIIVKYSKDLEYKDYVVIKKDYYDYLVESKKTK